MCDRITQIQDQVNQEFFNSQPFPQFYPGEQLWRLYRPKVKLQIFSLKISLLSDLPALFAQLITRSAKELELMIDHLPNENQSEELVLIEKLNNDNRKAGETLEDTIRLGENLLRKIQKAITDIGNAEIELALLDSGCSI